MTQHYYIRALAVGAGVICLVFGDGVAFAGQDSKETFVNALLRAKAPPVSDPSTTMTGGMSRSITIETGSDATPQTAAASDSSAQGGSVQQDSPLADLMITFKKGSAELSLDSIARAKQFAEALKDPRVASTRIEIAGHTDMSGSERTNRILSQRRADLVVEFLVEQGVQPSRVTGRGYGSTKLRYPEKPYSSRNRRVEARLL